MTAAFTSIPHPPPPCDPWHPQHNWKGGVVQLSLIASWFWLEMVREQVFLFKRSPSHPLFGEQSSERELGPSTGAGHCLSPTSPARVGRGLTPAAPNSSEGRQCCMELWLPPTRPSARLETQLLPLITIYSLLQIKYLKAEVEWHVFQTMVV